MKVTKHLFCTSRPFVRANATRRCWADSVTYDFTGTLATPFNGNGTVTGQFTIDFSTDAISAFDFTTPYSEVTASNYLPILVSANGFIGSNSWESLRMGAPMTCFLVFQTPIPFTAASLFTGPLPARSRVLCHWSWEAVRRCSARAIFRREFARTDREEAFSNLDLRLRRCRSLLPCSYSALV